MTIGTKPLCNEVSDIHKASIFIDDHFATNHILVILSIKHKNNPSNDWIPLKYGYPFRFVIPENKTRLNIIEYN